jgi:hypothetical protein
MSSRHSSPTWVISGRPDQWQVDPKVHHRLYAHGDETSYLVRLVRAGGWQGLLRSGQVHPQPVAGGHQGNYPRYDGVLLGEGWGISTETIISRLIFFCAVA